MQKKNPNTVREIQNEGILILSKEEKNPETAFSL